MVLICLLGPCVLILPINYSLFSKTQGPQGPASKLLFRPSVAGPCALCSNGKRRRVPQGPKAYSQTWLFMASPKPCRTLRPLGPLFWVLAIGCVVLLDMLAGWAQRDGCLNTALMASGRSVPGGIFCHTGPHRRIPPGHRTDHGTGPFHESTCPQTGHAKGVRQQGHEANQTQTHNTAHRARTHGTDA